jgi:RNA polymerase sigma-70 factor (ECF subfamily)
MAYLKPIGRRDDSDRPVAFEAEVLDHLDAMYGVALRYTKQPAAAEDLVQDTVVKAVRARHQYQPGTNLKAWLLRILTNTFINRHRRGGLERDVLEGPDAGPLADRWIGASSMRAMRDPEQEALAPLIEKELLQALDELPDHFRMVVVMCDVEGLSYKEIAEAMDTPVGTVMSRLHRARKMLQASLRQHAIDLGIIDEPIERRAAASDTHEPADLAAYRERKQGGRR